MQITLSLLVLFAPAVCVAAVLYIRVIRPMQCRLSAVTAAMRELDTQLNEERRLRADLVKWIEIETLKFPFITKALKQRIDERLEALRYLRNERRQQCRK